MTVVEKHPLLDQDDDSIYEEEYPTVQTKPLAGRASWPHLFVLLVTLLIGLSTGFATSHIISNKSRRVQNNTFCKWNGKLKGGGPLTDLTAAPAHDALSYSQQSMHPHGPKTYYGQPSMEQTKAWEKLLERKSNSDMLSLLPSSHSRSGYDSSLLRRAGPCRRKSRELHPAASWRISRLARSLP